MITAARISPSGTKKPVRKSMNRESMGGIGGGLYGEAVACFKDFLLSISDTEALRKFSLE
jgi:hypothetical protein